MLEVSNNGRFLVHGDGAPFFYLADTAWELFHRLDFSAADFYLRQRASQRFNVIQAVILAELDGLTTPNANGDLPLEDNDPTKPNEAYFQHVDAIVERTSELGLIIGMLPTWGDKWNRLWGVGPEIFTPDNAAIYGEWLGRRYRKAPLIWILGGDRPISDERSEQQMSIIRAMAQGLRRGDGGQHLMTFHPMGNAPSSLWFHEDDWLDFNMQQNGHGANTDVWNRIAQDFEREHKKPVLDGEPLYEGHPIGFNTAVNGYSVADDVRKFAYWDVFAGAFGHTYGHHSVWQMQEPRHGDGINDPLSTWQEAMGAPGAAQMQHIRALIESRPFLTRLPDQSLLTAAPSKPADHVQATRDANGSYALIYSATGQPFTVDLTRLSGNQITAHWFDPRTGEAAFLGQYERVGQRQFSPPSSGEGQDWVLILDDAARHFLLPGAQATS